MMLQKKKPAEAGHKREQLSVPQLAQWALDKGYRITPVYASGALGPYKDGQDYSDLSAPEWRGASHVGVILGRAVLVDYDGNKADEMGEYILPVGELGRLLGCELPAPAQVGADGRSLHYLFRLPEDVEVGVDVKNSADGVIADHIDIKCGNQVMHLKAGKDSSGLLEADALPVAPRRVLDVLRKGAGGGGSVQDAINSLARGTNVHGSALKISGNMISLGQSEMEVRAFFERYRGALEKTRGVERTARFFNGELSDMITGAVDQYGTTKELVPFEEEPVEVQVWDDWVYVAHEHKFYSRSKRESFKPEAFNGLMASQDTTVGRRNYKPAEFALSVVNIPKVAYAMYAPSFGEFFKYKGSECFNTYKPNFVPKASAQWSDIYQKHIELLFPQDWRVITQWMAYVVRNAGRKVLWSPLLKGIEGDGKTAIGNMIIAAMGQENAHQIDMDSIRSSFNAWAEGACFGMIEEVRVSGQNRHMVMDKLKPLITNSEISITRKGQDAFTALNTMNYLLLTNHEDALALSESDRRYGVFFTQFTERDQLPSIAEYYEPLWDAIRSRPGEVRGWLESIDLSDFNPNRAPDTTEAKRRMMLNSRSEATDLLAEALALGGLGVHPDTFNPKAVNMVIEEYKLGRSINNRQLAKAAAELGFEQWPVVKWHNSTHRAYVKSGCSSVTSNEDIRRLWESYSPFEAE